MADEENYLEINKKAWDEKTEFHLRSEFYNNEEFVKGKSSLNNIEISLLGNISGKSVLHLQCHFGQDTISLSRLGADAIGVDFSPKAISTAKELAEQTQSNTKFVCSDIYDLPHNLTGKFDIVFTSYGTIGWLPDLDKWAAVIKHFLKADGKFIIVEFHPVVWMFDNNFKEILYSYFNIKPIIESEEGTYADKNADLKTTMISWNHSLDEIFNSLLNHDFKITSFKEYNYSPYNCFCNTVEVSAGKYMIKGFENKLPMLYSIIAEV